MNQNLDQQFIGIIRAFYEDFTSDLDCLSREQKVALEEYQRKLTERKQATLRTKIINGK